MGCNLRIMKKKAFVYGLGLLVILVSAGCSNSINSLIKTGKPDEIYARALQLYEAEKWNKASTLFESIEHIYRGTPREDSLLFYNARCKYKNRDYETAVTLLDDFRRRYGRSAFIEDAEGMYATSYYNMSPAPYRDQTTTTQAIIAISDFMTHYPESDRKDAFVKMNGDLMQRLHEKAYLNAYTYYKIGKYKSAIVAFKNALKKYPESKRREEIMYLIVSASYRLAHNSVESKQADRYLSMLDSYYTFRSEYPESKYLKEMERMEKEAKDYSASHSSGEKTAAEADGQLR